MRARRARRRARPRAAPPRGAARAARPPLARRRRGGGSFAARNRRRRTSFGSSGVSPAASSSSSAAARWRPARRRLLRRSRRARKRRRRRGLRRRAPGGGPAPRHRVTDAGQRSVDCSALPDRRLLVADRREQRVGEADARSSSSSTTPSRDSRLERFEDTLPVAVRCRTSSTVGRASAADLEQTSSVSAGRRASGRRAAPAGSRARAGPRPAVGRVFVRTSSRPSSSAKNGLPAVASCTRASSGRVSSSPSRSSSRLCTAPRLSGPSESRSSRLLGTSARARTGSEVGASRRSRAARPALAQAPERDLEHAGGGRVEPLDVVEGDEDRAALGESTQDVEHGQPDRVRIGSHLARLGEQQRDLERPPPRRRERGRRPRRATSPRRSDSPANDERRPPPRCRGRSGRGRDAPRPPRRPPPRGSSCRCPPRRRARAPSGRSSTRPETPRSQPSSSSRPMTAVAACARHSERQTVGLRAGVAVAAQSRIVTTPASASTRSRSPVLIRFVAVPVPTTAGRPYSRATIAAWHMMPPESSTAAAILPKTGVQLGDVDGATRISPCSSSPSWSGAEDDARSALGDARRAASPGQRVGRRPSSAADEPLLDALVGDPPEHDRDRLGDRLGHLAQGRRWRPLAHRLVDRPCAARRSAASSAGRERPRRRRSSSAARSSSSASRTSLVTQVEDVLLLREEPAACASSAPNSRTLFQKSVKYRCSM